MSSKITDFHNKYKNNEKYVRMTKMWHRDIKWTNTFEKKKKKSTDRFAQCRGATNLQFVKYTVSAKCNKTLKHNKMKYACIICEHSGWVLDTITHLIPKITLWKINTGSREVRWLVSALCYWGIQMYKPCYLPSSIFTSEKI